MLWSDLSFFYGDETIPTLNKFSCFASLAGIQGSHADTVELDPAALLLRRETSEGEHFLF